MATDTKYMLKKYWLLVSPVEIRNQVSKCIWQYIYKTNSHNLFFILVNYYLIVKNVNLLILLTVPMYFWEMGSVFLCLCLYVSHIHRPHTQSDYMTPTSEFTKIRTHENNHKVLLELHAIKNNKIKWQ